LEWQCIHYFNYILEKGVRRKPYFYIIYLTALLVMVVNRLFYGLVFIALLFFVSCSTVYTCENGLVVDDQRMCKQTLPSDKSSCNYDSDCICGGMDTVSGECYIGNREYYETNVDKGLPCADFCSGIANNLVTKCINNKCVQIKKEKVQDTSIRLSMSYIEENCSFACFRNISVFGDGTVYSIEGSMENYNHVSISDVDQLLLKFKAASTYDVSVCSEFGGIINFKLVSLEKISSFSSDCLDDPYENLIDEFNNLLSESESTEPKIVMKNSFYEGETVTFKTTRTQKKYMLGSDVAYSKFSESVWNEMHTGLLSGCRVTGCFNGVSSQICSKKPDYVCIEMPQELSFKWDQKEWIKSRIDCGGTVDIDKKEQVSSGVYKVSLPYYIDPECSDQKIIEFELCEPFCVL